ncbi:hypothetical protein, partial [Klebsiella pneumoniae]|uniref:hypothetical protein n=1 Tax=Klebsiella pneumoniae TaxID=573 RepID=UPI00263A5E2E
ACVLPENPASYRVVRTKSYLFNKAAKRSKISEILWLSVDSILLTSYLPDISECYIESGLRNSFKY